jgi:ABC-type branched-subunit amino acid transport system substrate-binding protein
MKKISLLLVLFLFSCQAINQKILDLQTDKTEVLMQENPTHSQFESKSMDNFQLAEKKTRVALFLPFSGKNKDLGWSLFNAATLSLFNNDLNHSIEIVLFDSKDSASEAKDTFDEIVKKDIKIVIGPVFSSQIKEISKTAQRNKITVISLSNNQELLEEVGEDGGVFLGGMLPEMQVDKIVGYSMSRGKYSFATISPNNQYGKTVTDLMKATVRNRDGNFISAEFYNNTDKDIDRAVANIISVFNVSGHLMEGKNKLKKNAIISENDRIYPQIIMIPESGKTLSKIVASIKKQNVDEREFQIVGTSQWDDISTMNDFNLLGSWFVAPENEKFREFERAYYRSFNKFPPRIASIVYDSIAAVAEVRSRKDKESEIVITDFTKFDNPPKNGFEGIDGSFRFLPNGLVQRNLAVLQVGSGKFDTIEKPTEMFLKY